MMKTVTQQRTATGNSPPPNQARTIPAARATAPDSGLDEAVMIAGNVITARVT